VTPRLPSPGTPASASRRSGSIVSSPAFPLFVSIIRGELRLFLSEHRGDAVRNTLAYLRIRDVDAAASAVGAVAEDMEWGTRDDPDGNRLRIGWPLAAT
jgi:hypothetical protein